MAETPHQPRRGSAIPLLVIFAFLILAGILVWVVRPRWADTDHREAAALPADSSPAAERPARPPAARAPGPAVSVSIGPDFDGRDIRRIPLGTILNYASRTLTFDESRGGEATLRGSGASVRIAPEHSVGYLTRDELGEGRIVARIRSDSAVPDLGLASGLNYLWMEQGDRGLRGVVIPATAFSPLHQLDRIVVSRPAARGLSPTRGASWVEVKGRTVPWVACARC